MDEAIIHIDEFENIEWEDASLCTYTLSAANEIWCINISSATPYISRLWALLNADECKRANGYYRENDRHRFIISRGILRILLGKYLIADPISIVFQTGVNNKPSIKDRADVHYNVSHSGDYILIGLSRSEIGVDVEGIDINIHYNEIMQISYSNPEIEFVKLSDNPIQNFYKLWTRKEALLKATAKGIDDDLKLIPCLSGTHLINAQIIAGKPSWIVKGFVIDDQHVGCIASQTDKYNLFWWNDTFFTV